MECIRCGDSPPAVSFATYLTRVHKLLRVNRLCNRCRSKQWRDRVVERKRLCGLKTKSDAATNAIEMGVIEVHDNGSIWRLLRKINTGELKPIAPRRAECKGGRGYWFVHLSIDRIPYSVAAHRIVWEYFHDPIPEELQINHIDGNKQNNNPQNLELVTVAENLQHAIRIGLRPSRTKITPAEVALCRQLRSSGETYVAIGARFGFSNVTAKKICNGDGWFEQFA